MVEYEAVDHEVRRLLATGSPRAAYELRVATYANNLSRYVASRLPAAANTVDVVNEVWVAVLQSLPRARPDVPLVGWILGIARHKLADAFDASSYDELPSHLSQVEGLNLFANASRPTTPSQAVLNQQRTELLRQALTALRPTERDLIDLRYVQGLKPKAIAAMLDDGATPNAISTRLVAAVRKLRERMHELASFDSERRS